MHSFSFSLNGSFSSGGEFAVRALTQKRDFDGFVVRIKRDEPALERMLQVGLAQSGFGRNQTTMLRFCRIVATGDNSGC